MAAMAVVAPLGKSSFCVMTTNEPGCLDCPEINTVDPPLFDLITENVCVLVADDELIDGDRLWFAIGDTVRKCLNVVCLNACADVTILPIEAGAVAFVVVGKVTPVVVSVTIFGGIVSILETFRSLLR